MDVPRVSRLLSPDVQEEKIIRGSVSAYYREAMGLDWVMSEIKAYSIRGLSCRRR